MPGTLLAFDNAFPRARAPTGDAIINRPRADELRANSYPAPYTLLPIGESATPREYIRTMTTQARRLRGVDTLIVFAHGQVTNTGRGHVMTGILLGSAPIEMANVALLRSLRPTFARGAHVELWVCQAASPTEVFDGRHHLSGHNLCQAIADALQRPVQASASDQQTTTASGAGSYTSEVNFLPWEGPVETFRPRVR